MPSARDTEEAARYCEDLRTLFGRFPKRFGRATRPLDYLISSKLALAEQEHIKTKVNIEYPHNTNIRSVDLTTILGNLLDNALEAAQAAPDGLRFPQPDHPADQRYADHQSGKRIWA